MKQFEKWRSLCVTGLVLGCILALLLFLKKEYIFMVAALVIWIILMCAFFGFWNSLKKHGMKFVGTTVVYAYLQAVGVIWSHEDECFCRQEDEI